jgi:hypothetical protein
MPGEYIGFGGFLALSCLLCGGEYEHERGHSAWIRKLDDVYERPLPSFDAASDIVRHMDACYDSASRHAAGVGFVGQPYLLEGMTLLSLFRGMDRLCLDMCDRPETVLRRANAIAEVNLAFQAHWYRRIEEAGHTPINTCFWGPTALGRCDFVQCDFAVMISPADFNRYVMPYLERATQWLDYSLYHLDGMAQLRHLDSLASLPGLNGIQVNPEPGRESPLHWLDELRGIRKRGLSVYAVCTSAEEAVALAGELGPDGLYIRVEGIENEDQAQRLIETVGRTCRCPR